MPGPKKLNVGDLILLKRGGIAVLIERFDPYLEERKRRWNQTRLDGVFDGLGAVASGGSDPFGCNFAWRISFTGGEEGSSSYNEDWGWSEMNIRNTAYGEVIGYNKSR